MNQKYKTLYLSLMIITLAIGKNVAHNATAGNPRVEDTQLLDAMIEEMSPGYLAALEANSSGETIRYNGADYPVGSYEWCNSDRSDELCDSEWDAICGDAYNSGHRGAARRRVTAAEGAHKQVLSSGWKQRLRSHHKERKESSG